MHRTLLFFFPLSLFATDWYTETLYDSWGQTFRIDEVLYEEKTEQQELRIFQNAQFGRILALDGAIQTTEADEWVYHEMMTHVPLLTHPHPESILIIGGGDGGILREVLRHSRVKKVTLVEIDGSVVTFSKAHLPELSKGAFDDPRARIVIEDGCQFVKETDERYDIILCDSTDPVGPGAVLFTSEFYRDCHNCLKEGGIFVNQNGVPFLQKEELSSTFKTRSESFSDVTFYLGVIPTYVGGFMAFGWASDTPTYRQLSLDTLRERLETVDGEMHYYTPEIHLAAFALPRFMQQQLEK